MMIIELLWGKNDSCLIKLVADSNFPDEKKSSFFIISIGKYYQNCQFRLVWVIRYEIQVQKKHFLLVRAQISFYDTVWKCSGNTWRRKGTKKTVLWLKKPFKMFPIVQYYVIGHLEAIKENSTWKTNLVWLVLRAKKWLLCVNI